MLVLIQTNITRLNSLSLHQVLRRDTYSRSSPWDSLTQATLLVEWKWSPWLCEQLDTLRSLLGINCGSSLPSTCCLLQDKTIRKTDLARDSLLGEKVERKLETLRRQS